VLLNTLITGVTILMLSAGAVPAGAAGDEHHEFHITESSVIEWLSDEESCDTKEAEFQCLNHGDAYTIKAKMFKDCTGKHVYIHADAIKKGGDGGHETAEAVTGFVLTKRMAAKDCSDPGECALDAKAVCPLLDVAEVLNSDLVVIQRGD
jgi:hypothetical protein